MLHIYDTELLLSPQLLSLSRSCKLSNGGTKENKIKKPKLLCVCVCAASSGQSHHPIIFSVPFRLFFFFWLQIQLTLVYSPPPASLTGRYYLTKANMNLCSDRKQERSPVPYRPISVSLQADSREEGEKRKNKSADLDAFTSMRACLNNRKRMCGE